MTTTKTQSLCEYPNLHIFTSTLQFQEFSDCSLTCLCLTAQSLRFDFLHTGIYFHICLKVALLTFNCLHGCAPPCSFLFTISSRFNYY